MRWMVLVCGVLAGCASAVQPTPSLYIEPSCDAHVAGLITAATGGYAVTETGTQWQDGRAYWGADMVFYCAQLETCSDYPGLIAMARGTMWPVATNCDATDDAVMARVRGYATQAGWSP